LWNLKAKKTLERSKYRWVDSIKMYVKEIGREDVNCIVLVHDKDKRRDAVSSVMKFLLPYDWLGNHQLLKYVSAQGVCYVIADNLPPFS
jgi:hypothetical protein